MFLPYGDDVERRKFPIIPILIILLNVIVLIYSEMLISGDDEQFTMTTSFFANYGLQHQHASHGKLSGFLTYMFLHDGIIHLLGNMVILWAIGRSICAVLGRVNFLLLYLACGIFGGFCHLLLSESSTLPLVGASGAIAGLIGAYAVAFSPFSKVKCVVILGFIPLHFRIPAMIFGAIWFALQILQAWFNPLGMQDISWFAHLGGFGLGTLVMLIAQHRVRPHVESLMAVKVKANV